MKTKQKSNSIYVVGTSSRRPFYKCKAQERGITLVALIITIIVLIILAAVTIIILTEAGILRTASKGAEDFANAQEYEKQIINNIDEKAKDLVKNITEGKPTFEIKITKIDGTALTGDETEKAITINITNIEEPEENYTIEVKDKNGNTISKETNVINGITGQASYIINKSGSYTITVTITKDGIISETITKTENITVAMEQIEETAAFSRANGVIDIVWLNEDNTVRKESEGPLSPKDHLGGLTAIKYNGTTEETVNDPANDSSWYNYVAQTGKADGKTSNWANARSSDKNAYFVWIPRYAYKITYFDTPDHANAYREDQNSKIGIIGYSNIYGIIDVRDGTEKLVKGTAPTNVVGTVKTASYSEYIPHPAFEFDGSKAGIWVGKFESSGSTSAVTIIPNKLSLQYINVNDIFTACQGVKTTYSLTGDSHMMKNIEWGAVAYLTESKYGRNGTEVTINTSKWITGGGTNDTYKTTNAVQSTTGNIYGIYDMNGGSIEYVAGYINNSNVVSNGHHTSLLNAVKENSKYANVYTVTADDRSSNYSNTKGMKGDAIFETSTSGNSDSSAWHSDISMFPQSIHPAVWRGRLP